MIDQFRLYRISRTVLLIQGVYFFLSGAWALLDLPSFLAVTGPKTDLWLVQTVGLIIMVMGSALTAAGIRATVSVETLILSIGSAVALTGIEVGYVISRTIPSVYLLDAAIEVLILIAWIVIAWFYFHTHDRRSEWHPESRRRLPLMHPRQFGY